jgi:hypothetical protein
MMTARLARKVLKIIKERGQRGNNSGSRIPTNLDEWPIVPNDVSKVTGCSTLDEQQPR